MRAFVTSVMAEFMPGAIVHVVDAVRMGPSSAPRVFFLVETLEQADAVVRHRSGLKGSSFTMFDVLSPEERQLHTRLWPRFLAAVAQGQKAQFQRARLFVDGVVVTS
jgi:hypothetical protein